MSARAHPNADHCAQQADRSEAAIGFGEQDNKDEVERSAPGPKRLKSLKEGNERKYGLVRQAGNRPWRQVIRPKASADGERARSLPHPLGHQLAQWGPKVPKVKLRVLLAMPPPFCPYGRFLVDPGLIRERD